MIGDDREKCRSLSVGAFGGACAMVMGIAKQGEAILSCTRRRGFMEGLLRWAGLRTVLLVGIGCFVAGRYSTGFSTSGWFHVSRPNPLSW